MGQKRKEQEKLWDSIQTKQYGLALQAMSHSCPGLSEPWPRCEVRSPTYTDNVHEAVHSIADLEEQVLALPLG